MIGRCGQHPAHRSASLALAALVATGCATGPTYPAPAWAHLGPHPYRLGDYRVLMLSMDAARAVCRGYMAEAQRAQTDRSEIHGCHVLTGREAYIVLGIANVDEAAGAFKCLHEFKHTVDGAFHP